MENTALAARVPRVPVASPLRLARLSKGIALSEAARMGGLSLSRASILEREPSLAKEGELDRLRVGVERAAEAAGRA